MYEIKDKFFRQGKLRKNTITDFPVRICILGGGFGGLYTALELSKINQLRQPDYEITLVEKRDHFLFTPLLYEVVTGELRNGEIAPTYKKLLADSEVKFCQAEIQGVDLENNSVKLQNGDIINYDYLVLAVGKETRLDIVPGAAEYAQTFRSLEDAEYLKEKLRVLEASDIPVIRIAIAGAGPNGVEIACKLADKLKKRGEIRLIDRSDEILKTFPPGCRTASYRALLKLGVQINLRTNIEAIKSDQIILNYEGKTQQFHTDLVLWTGGNKSIQWIKELNCQHNQQGQLIATPTLQLAGYPHIFVLGDLAEIRDIKGNESPTTAQAAFQQAPCTARNIWAKITGQKLKSFSYLYLGEMLTLGIKNAVIYSFGITLDGNLARIIRRGVYIQRLPTLKHKLQVAKRWIFGRMRK
ncbi:NAD(P)/FAD-dependent oxidoreductase [Anabaena sp. UHCC 0204]|uniref:NAD(P)/FAD-dependent oxidoreductase n=1 Tax=Anabaena sp. UHCC 0204 TaxID=2590009 RepID=UPI001448569C|nr:NAD(P)/FAD-dependent oxidoreductase [Anabaena sp. UHCC 0204]MTJ07678.1 NAD(P)/FAD-dependent oxidoreductase [Anabaena sp. UHCC 0204]